MTINYKQKKVVLVSVLSFLSVLLVISISLFSYQRAYAGKIYENTYFGDINLSGKSKSQASAIIKNKVDQQLERKITTQTESGKAFETKFSETGVYIDVNGSATQAYHYGRDSNFFKTLLTLSKSLFVKNVPEPEAIFDEDVYSNYLNRSSEALNIQPVNASLSIKDGKVTTGSEQKGDTIDSSTLKEEIKSNLTSSSDNVLIAVPTSPITPALLSENLTEAKTQAETYLTHQITLTIADQVYTSDINTVGSWIIFGQRSEKYAAWLDNLAIKKFINKAAARNDISVIDKKISSVDNSVIQEGRQGIYVDQDDALNKIVGAMNSSSPTTTVALLQTTKDPQIVTVFPDEGVVAGRFPGKYIDVDVTKQMMTLFEGSSNLGSYQISSGKASMPTPTGTRYIVSKDPRAWSSKYGLYMPWWNSIGGEYGIHELPEWPGGYKEGEAHLGTPVSHGCIRLGVGPAQMVYNWADIGTPVYIHK